MSVDLPPKIDSNDELFKENDLNKNMLVLNAQDKKLWKEKACCGRPWPAAYINIIQNTHQIQVLTEALCRAQAIFYSLPNNEWGTKCRGLT